VRSKLALRRRAIIIASLVDSARGYDRSRYGWFAVVAAIAYLAAIVIFRIRG
jgi:hypothetical protein